MTKKIEIVIRHGKIQSADAEGFRGQGCVETIDKIFAALKVKEEQEDLEKPELLDKEMEQHEI